MSSRQSGALQAVEVMLNGSLRRLNILKDENREALYNEYKDPLSNLLRVYCTIGPTARTITIVP